MVKACIYTKEKHFASWTTQCHLMALFCPGNRQHFREKRRPVCFDKDPQRKYTVCQHCGHKLIMN